MLRAVVLLLLVLPLAASATPVSLELSFDDTASAGIDLGGLGGSAGACTTRSACSAAGASGSLSADLAGSVLSNVQGTIVVDGIGAVLVTDGQLDLSGATASYFTTSHWGDFHFGSLAFAGGSWSFWGGNWGGSCGSGGCKQFWLRFDSRIVPTIPEPSAALLFGLGGIVVSRRISRRRRPTRRDVRASLPGAGAGWTS